MTRQKMGARKNGKPTAARLKLWVDSVSSATLPLLAGFSTTSVVVVSDDAANFRWSGATILALAIAAVVLIAAVQFAYHARIALSESSDQEDGQESPVPSQGNSHNDANTQQIQQHNDYNRGLAWIRRTRWAYDVGLLSLLAGLGLAVAPYHVDGTEAFLRWLASGLAFFACALELRWTVVDPLLRAGKAKQ
jgi:hypothetical protein